MRRHNYKGPNLNIPNPLHKGPGSLVIVKGFVNFTSGIEFTLTYYTHFMIEIKNWSKANFKHVMFFMTTRVNIKIAIRVFPVLKVEMEISP